MIGGAASMSRLAILNAERRLLGLSNAMHSEGGWVEGTAERQLKALKSLAGEAETWHIFHLVMEDLISLAEDWRDMIRERYYVSDE